MQPYIFLNNIEFEYDKIRIQISTAETQLTVTM